MYGIRISIPNVYTLYLCLEIFSFKTKTRMSLDFRAGTKTIYGLLFIVEELLRGSGSNGAQAYDNSCY